MGFFTKDATDPEELKKDGKYQYYLDIYSVSVEYDEGVAFPQYDKLIEYKSKIANEKSLNVFEALKLTSQTLLGKIITIILAILIIFLIVKLALWITKTALTGGANIALGM